jgi:hypothetical protein
MRTGVLSGRVEYTAEILRRYQRCSASMPTDQIHIELLSAILAEDAAAVERLAGTGRFDFTKFRSFTDLHHLSTYLYLHIKGSPVAACIPADFLAYLGGRHAIQRQRCDDTLREAAQIHDAFLNAGQDLLFLKGPFVAQQFYGDIYQRTFMDIDVLIPREDLAAAGKLLEQMGFARRSLVFISNNAMSRCIHAYEYRKQLKGNAESGHRKYLPLDLHSALQCHPSFSLDYETIWRRQEHCLLGDRQYPVLGREYALVLAVLGILVDIRLGTIRLKSLLDVYKMLDSLDPVQDWDAFFNKRAEENIFLITLNVIDLVLSVLRCRSSFPRIARYLDENQRSIRLTDMADKQRLLNRSRFSKNSMYWTLGLYQAPALQSRLWSLMTIPFRVAAHESRDPRIIRRLRDRLRG